MYLSLKFICFFFNYLLFFLNCIIYLILNYIWITTRISLTHLFLIFIYFFLKIIINFIIYLFFFLKKEKKIINIYILKY
jgi:hypothetical protein